MHGMTVSNLRSAFGGESMAHMRYMIWADKADRDGFANVARLFRAISSAEQVHATSHFAVLKSEMGGADVTAGGGFGLSSTSQNLQAAIDGENFEVHEMYPAYVEVAKHQQEAAAQRSFNLAMEAEKIHAALYSQAKQSVDAGKDLSASSVKVCKVCGYTHLGEGPDQCPICKARKESFITF